MSISAPPLPSGTKIDGEFLVRETLGKGKGGGAVYRVGRCSRPGSALVALKFPAGSTELEALEGVQEALGVPRLLASGHYRGQRYAVTQTLGVPLSELFRRIEPMSIEDKWGVVKLLGRMFLRRLEAVHRCGWVHGDVAPDNALFGRTEEGHISMFLIDFGCARRFPGGEAVKAFWNTVEFASIRAVEDTIREPYDDLESLGYVLCHGIFGDLPWFRWTRGRNNWEETRSKDCERVRQGKLTFLRGEWCSLGFEWIQLMKMPLDLTKFLARCLYRPKAEDGLPDYKTLTELLGQPVPETEIAEALDVGFLTDKCQDLAPPHQPERPPPAPPPPAAPGAASPCGRDAHSAGRGAAPPAPAECGAGGRSPSGEIAPERTRSSLFDFDELEEEAPAGEDSASETPGAAPGVREVEAEQGKHRLPANELERTGSTTSPRTPRTKSRWFDFDKLDDMDVIEAQ